MIKRTLAFLAVFFVTSASLAQLVEKPDLQGQDVSRSIVKSAGGTVARPMSDHLADVVFAANYGVKCDGTTDDTANLKSAMDHNRSKTVVLPGSVCRLASTLVMEPSTALTGNAFMPGNPASGSVLLCDASVTPCVQMGLINVNSTQYLSKVVVSRAGGAPSPDKEGIRTYGYNNTIVDVMVYNQGIGFNLTAQQPSGAGLGVQMTRVYSGAISGSHLVLDTIPEVRISQGRFGMNGSGDYNSDAFVTIKGGAPGTAAGPNTFTVENFQFNQGTNGPQYWIKFVNCAVSPCVPDVDARMWRFTDVHVEGLSTGGVFSDASWNVIGSFYTQGLSFNNPTKPFWALNAATTLTDVGFYGAVLQTSSFSLTPTANISNFSIVGSSIVSGPVEISPASANASAATLVGNVFGNGLNISGFWGSLVRVGNYLYGGTVTDTATGNKVTLDPQSGNQVQSLIINSPLTAAASPLDVRATAPSSYVRSRVANFSTSNNSVAEFQLSTAVANSYLSLSVTNGGGTPTATLGVGSAVASLQTNVNGHTFASQAGAHYLELTGTNANFGVPVKMPGYTVSSLPVAPGMGARAFVTDATACTFGGALTGGGSIYCPVTFNGTTWQGG